MGDGSPSRLNSKGKGRAPQNGDILALNLDTAEEGTALENGGAFQQMQLVEQQVCDDKYVSRLIIVQTVCIGQLHSIPINRHRIYRIYHRGTWPNIHPTSHYGCRTARNRSTHRRRHYGYRVERKRGTEGAPKVLC